MGVTGERATVGHRGASSSSPTPARPAPSACASGSASPDREQAAEVAGYADGVIVGSALVRTLLDAADDAAGRATRWPG